MEGKEKYEYKERFSNKSLDDVSILNTYRWVLMKIIYSVRLIESRVVDILGEIVYNLKVIVNLKFYLFSFHSLWKFII